jgi:hypothetical protein
MLPPKVVCRVLHAAISPGFVRRRLKALGAASEETRRALLRLGPVECYWFSGQPLCYRQWLLAMSYLPLFLFPPKKEKNLFVIEARGYVGKSKTCPRPVCQREALSIRAAYPQP